jgi:hypothetical protein
VKATWVGVVLLAGTAVGLGGGVARGAETEFSFPRLNGQHTFSEVVTAPSEWGPLHVQIRVRNALLRILSHRLYLSPLEDGTHRARIIARVEGSGAVSAETTVLGFSTQQADEVLLPAQDQRLSGRVRLDRDATVYRVTAVDLPRYATVQIQSRLGERLGQWCDGIPLLETLGGDCAEVRRALTWVRVSLPKPGETYEIRREELTQQERETLDRYLAPGRPPR